MTVPPSPRLPINTVEELFDKLRWEEARLVESWSVYDSWNFVVTTYHLCEDWIRKEGSVATQAQRDRLGKLPPEAERLFKAIRQIANASKHFDLLPKWKMHQIVGEISEPGISDYDSYIFGEMISIPYDDYLVSMSAASAMVMRYLEWVIYGGDNASFGDIAEALASMKNVAQP
jgi:hypothetical protein